MKPIAYTCLLLAIAMPFITIWYVATYGEFPPQAIIFMLFFLFWFRTCMNADKDDKRRSSHGKIC